MGIRSALMGKVESPVDMSAVYEKYPAVERVEMNNDHRIGERAEIVSHIPHGSVGAEIGVFTGVFSEYLISSVEPSRFYQVDAWDISGDVAWNPPDGAHWAPYVDYGRLTYDAARESSKAHAVRGNTTTVTERSTDWLYSLPADSLDWVYLDTSHHYEATLAELDAMAHAVRPGGLLLGDDAWTGQEEYGFGVHRAIHEWVDDVGGIFYLRYGQFGIRV